MRTECIWGSFWELQTFRVGEDPCPWLCGEFGSTNGVPGQDTLSWGSQEPWGSKSGCLGHLLVRRPQADGWPAISMPHYSPLWAGGVGGGVSHVVMLRSPSPDCSQGKLPSHSNTESKPSPATPVTQNGLPQSCCHHQRIWQKTVADMYLFFHLPSSTRVSCCLPTWHSGPISPLHSHFAWDLHELGSKGWGW